METEWQFVADDLAAVRGWLENDIPAPFRVSAEPERAQDDEYWDTGGWLVWRAGFACRVRRQGESAELTLKELSGGEANLRRRRELNEPLDGLGGIEGASARPAGEASRLLRRLAGPHALRPVASLTTHRTTLSLADAGGPLGAIALDRTTVGEGWRAHDLLRVEVEVDERHLDRTAPFVEALREGAGLRPALSGKLAAALAAAGASPGWEPRPLGSMTFDRESTLGEIAYAILRREYLHFVQHEPVARLGEDVEGVHQMRVSARRLRAAIETFREALPAALVEQGGELRWLTHALGDMRDLDVQRERLARLASPVDPKVVAALDAILREQYEQARETMLAALDSKRYVAMVDSLADLLRRGAAGGAGDVPALEGAPGLIRGWRRRVRRAGDAIEANTPHEAYHQLRLKTKALRYAIEFFAPLYGEPAEAYGRQMARLQRLLGDHQDAIVAADLYQRLASDEGERLGRSGVRAARELAANATAEAEGYRWKFPKRYARLRGRAWKGLRAAMLNS